VDDSEVYQVRARAQGDHTVINGRRGRIDTPPSRPLAADPPRARRPEDHADPKVGIRPAGLCGLIPRGRLVLGHRWSGSEWLRDPGARELDLLLYKAGITIVPFSPEHLAAARHAFGVFGKGRHAAALNFGDCFSYALSKSTGEPLLLRARTFRTPNVARHPLP